MKSDADKVPLSLCVTKIPRVAELNKSESPLVEDSDAAVGLAILAVKDVARLSELSVENEATWVLPWLRESTAVPDTKGEDGRESWELGVEDGTSELAPESALVPIEDGFSEVTSLFEFPEAVVPKDALVVCEFGSLVLVLLLEGPEEPREVGVAVSPETADAALL